MVDRNEVFFAPPSLTSLTSISTSLQKKKKMMVTYILSSMEPSPSFSLVFVSRGKKLRFSFANKKEKLSFVKSFVEKEKNKGKEKLEKKKFILF